DRATRERGGPRRASREVRVGETEAGFRRRARERAERRVRRERRAVLDREAQRDGTGRDREADEPAAHRVAPAAAGEAGGGDQRRRQHELPHEHLGYPTAQPPWPPRLLA